MSSMRTHYCGLVTEELLGQTVSLCGWVHRRRDHGTEPDGLGEHLVRFDVGEVD